MEAKRICVRPPQTTIYDLNDDVLRETFGHMNVEELGEMVDICSTFRRLALDEFASRKYKVYFARAHEEDEISEHHNNILRIGMEYPHFVCFIRRFGIVMTSIYMYSPRQNDSRHLPLKAIAKYCSRLLLDHHLKSSNWTGDLILEWQPLLSRLRKITLHDRAFDHNADASEMLSFCVELESLEINGMGSTYFGSPVLLPKLNSLGVQGVKWTNEMISNWQPSLARVKYLKLLNCTFESGADASQMLSLCVELQLLSLDVSSGEGLTSPVALPQLKSLTLSGMYMTSAVERLIALNPQLEEIELRFLSSSQMIEMVYQYVPNITKIGFENESDVIVDWKKFKNLKSLDISGSYTEVSVLQAVAEAAIPLESLRVQKNSSLPTAAFIQQMLKFKNLREIDLVSCLSFTLIDISTMVRTFPDLNTLSLKWIPLSFAAIPEIIKCGPKLKSLTYDQFVYPGDAVDDCLFMRIRNAVLDHSEHWPFRLVVNSLGYINLRMSRKLQRANSHILQIEWLKF